MTPTERQLACLPSSFFLLISFFFFFHFVALVYPTNRRVCMYVCMYRSMRSRVMHARRPSRRHDCDFIVATCRCCYRPQASWKHRHTTNSMTAHVHVCMYVRSGGWWWTNRTNLVDCSTELYPNLFYCWEEREQYAAGLCKIEERTHTLLALLFIRYMHTHMVYNADYNTGTSAMPPRRVRFDGDTPNAGMRAGTMCVNYHSV